MLNPVKKLPTSGDEKLIVILAVWSLGFAIINPVLTGPFTSTKFMPSPRSANAGMVVSETSTPLAWKPSSANAEGMTLPASARMLTNPEFKTSGLAVVRNNAPPSSGIENGNDIGIWASAKLTAAVIISAIPKANILAVNIFNSLLEYASNP